MRINTYIHLFLISVLVVLSVNLFESISLELFSVEGYENNLVLQSLSFFVLISIFVFFEILIFPIFNLILIPFRILTLGLISFFISVLFVWFITFIYPPFSVDSGLMIFFLGFALAGIRRATTIY